LDTTTQVLAILILLLGLVMTAIVPQFVRRRREVLRLRPQAAYASLDLTTAQAVESGQTVLIGMGNTGIGGETTALALAAEAVAYQTLVRAAFGDRSPAVTVSDATGLAFAQDASRSAYRYHGTVPPRGTARWLPAGPRSLAYAAAMTAYVSGDGAQAQVLVGRFGTELALIGEAGVRRGGTVIAASDQLDGQAVAYAFSKHPLIGEEIFQASAYLSESAVRRGEAVALDVLRWILIAAIIALAASRILNTGG
jgi:hypothetical protein